LPKTVSGESGQHGGNNVPPARNPRNSYVAEAAKREVAVEVLHLLCRVQPATQEHLPVQMKRSYLSGVALEVREVEVIWQRLLLSRKPAKRNMG
jgi:hypothetical protein